MAEVHSWVISLRFIEFSVGIREARDLVLKGELENREFIRNMFSSKHEKRFESYGSLVNFEGGVLGGSPVLNFSGVLDENTVNIDEGFIVNDFKASVDSTTVVKSLNLKRKISID